MSPDEARTMTTYKRYDGEMVAGEYGWVADIEFFEDDDEPTKVVKEVWTLQSEEVLVVGGSALGECFVDYGAEECERDAVCWVEAPDGELFQVCEDHLGVFVTEGS